jgi:hypothetical protein
MSAKSNENAKKPGVVPTSEMKLKSTADFEAGKQAVDIGHEHGIPPKRVKTTVADKNIKIFQN